MFYRRRVCAYCGKEFYATAPGQKYCSYECKEKALKEKRREYRRRRVERGKSYSPKPKPGDKCVQCGFDIHYALEFSHEVNAFLCANCHRKLHPGSRNRMTLSPSGVPVKLVGALYDPGFPYEPLRCFLCKRSITPTIWERQHMIPRSCGGEHLGNQNIVIVCANCHRIIHRAGKYINKEFVEFLKTKKNPYYLHYNTLDTYKRLSPAVQLEIVRAFYIYLRENWEKVLNMIRQG